MATSKYSSHTADVNRPDRGGDGNLLGSEAFKRAQTLMCEIEESERNRQYLLQSDARARIRLSIIGAPGPSYEIPERGIIDLQRSALVALLEDEITERQQKLAEMGIEPPAAAARPANWTNRAEPSSFNVAESPNTTMPPDRCPAWP
jgi:hypothetical protein